MRLLTSSSLGPYHLVLEQVGNSEQQKNNQNLGSCAGSLQDGIHLIKLGVTGKLQQLEEMINKLSEMIFTTKGTSNHSTHGQLITIEL